jgi:hypothetical protein
MNRAEPPPPPRKPGKAAVLILLVIAAIILIIFFARNIWHGEELQKNQEAGNNVAENYQGPSNY